MSVRLRTKKLWVRVPLQSLKFHISRLLWARSSLTFRQLFECRFTLKRVRDMITYSQLKLLGFGPARTFTLLMFSCIQKLSLLFITMTTRISILRFTSIQTQMHIFISYQSKKTNNILGRSSYRKTWLSIYNVQKLWTSILYRQPTIWSTPFFILFLNPPLLTSFTWKYCPNEMQDKHKKNLQDKVISSKQHYMSFIIVKFISNAGCDLIRNNNNLVYQKEKKNKSSEPEHLKVIDIE